MQYLTLKQLQASRHSTISSLVPNVSLAPWLMLQTPAIITALTGMIDPESNSPL